MIAIPDMDKPKKGEVIAFDGEYAVYTDDDMKVHRYPLIEIVQCKDCKRYEIQADGLGRCTGWDRLCNDDHFCSFGERRADETDT